MMFAGELLAGAFESARERGISVALVAFAVWGCLGGAAVQLQSPFLLLLGAVAFGLSNGLFHTVLDGWFAGVLEGAGLGKETPRRLTQGWLTYNVGYVVGAGAAFPLLFAGRLGYDPKDLFNKGQFTLAPYGLGTALALIGVWVLTPNTGGRVASKSVSSRFLDALLRLPGEYSLVIRHGGIGLGAAVFAGASVSLMVQSIDHCAPSLIDASTVGTEALAIVVMNGIVCLGALGLDRYLAYLSRRESDNWASRRTVMTCSLCSVSAFFGVLTYLSMFGTLKAGSIGDAVLLGVAQAMLVTLPPLAKAWTLLFAGKEHKNVAIVVLGA